MGYVNVAVLLELADMQTNKFLATLELQSGTRDG